MFVSAAVLVFSVAPKCRVYLRVLNSYMFMTTEPEKQRDAKCSMMTHCFDIADI